MEELQRRGIQLKARNGNSSGSVDSVALVGEWDTVYARAATLAFCAAAQGTTLDPLIKDAPLILPRNISRHNYTRGIDGKLPTDSASDEARQGKQKSFTLLTPGAGPELPEGQNQADYLRRLAGELEQEDRRLRAEGTRGIRAVGILGSDVYDKLQVLQALRPRLPGALFFTTDMDVRLFHPDAWPYAHNLLIVSHFGLETRLGNDDLSALAQARVAPFRDGYQTATFCAVLAALGKLPLDGEALAHQIPRIYEVGRAGPVDLSVQGSGLPGKELTVHARRPDDIKWWSPQRIAVGAQLLLLAVAIILWLLLVSGMSRIRLLSLILFHWSFIPSAILVIAVCLIWLKNHLPPDQEPLLMFQGVSVWPTEAARILAGLMCVHFMIRAWHDMRASQKEVEASFILAPPRTFWRAGWRDYLERRRKVLAALTAVPTMTEQQTAAVAEFCPATGSRGCELVSARSCPLRLVGWWRRLAYGLFPVAAYNLDHAGELRHIAREYFARLHAVCFQGRRCGRGWRRRMGRWLLVLANQWPRSRRPVLSARGLWLRYRLYQSPIARIARFGPVLFLYYLFGRQLFELLGSPAAPVRGSWAAAVDKFALHFSVALLITLTFFIADATRLCQRFIEQLCQKTRWPSRKLEEVARECGLPPDDLDELLDIRLIERLTYVIGRTIYYPFIILTLLILSRNSYFDDWNWPVSLLVIYLMTAGYAIVAAMVMRRAAEEAREEDLKPLRKREQRYTLYDPIRAARIRKVVKEIEAAHDGAFAPITRNPVLGAFLLPSGGLGAWALLEAFANGQIGG